MGRRSRKNWDWKRSFGGGLDNQTIDRDFDDTYDDIAWLRERIGDGRALSLSPDGDRRSSNHDPVPLHSHVPDGDEPSSEFCNPRLYAKKRVADIRARRREEAWRKAKVAAEEEAESVRWSGEMPPVRNENPLPRPLVLTKSPWWAVELTPEQAMLNNMRLNEPLAPGIARVWQQYVMVNDDDVINPTLMHYGPWVEVWRDGGKIIYKVAQ